MRDVAVVNFDFGEILAVFEQLSVGTGHGAAQRARARRTAATVSSQLREPEADSEQVVEKLGGQCEVHRTAAADAGFFAGNGIAEYVFGGGGG